jgi:hypothetical protein
MPMGSDGTAVLLSGRPTSMILTCYFHFPSEAGSSVRAVLDRQGTLSAAQRRRAVPLALVEGMGPADAHSRLHPSAVVMVAAAACSVD